MNRSVYAVGKPIRGTTVCTAILLVFTGLPLPAQTFTTLHSFEVSDSKNPEAGLIEATNGELYGTGANGGANSEGTAFKITRAGALTALYNFCSQPNCADGATPSAALLQAGDQTLYGTTSSAGANSFYAEYGTVFKMTPAGALTTIYSFCSQPNCTDGAGPLAGLTEAADGNFYGTTGVGGVNQTCFLGCGTVFQITPAGVLTTLYNFCSEPNCTDGSDPEAGLVPASNGDLYGTTQGGGANGQGTIFQMTPTGGFTTIYNFCSQTNCTDGAGPVAALVEGVDGNLYGTTATGGSNCLPDGCGTLFKITLGGQLTTLYSFCAQANCADGKYPSAGLIQATDGNFYGTTKAAGANSSYAEYGTIFRITPGGTVTTLYNFCSEANCADGDGPLAELVQATDGKFYGTTVMGGIYNSHLGGAGTVFRLSVGLEPFVKTNIHAGKVGQSVKIIGGNLTGATSVTFDGTAAAFTVHSDSSIFTAVPAGSTSGEVQVTTPQGKFSSNVPFRVLP